MAHHNMMMCALYLSASTEISPYIENLPFEILAVAKQNIHSQNNQ